MLNLNDHVLRIVTSRNSKDELFDHTHSHRRRHSPGSPCRRVTHLTPLT